MTKLYVGNLSYNTNEESLRQFFEQEGRAVRRVSIITDRDTGQSRGFGFVEMDSPADAEAAISQLDGAELDGRTLRVNEARERRPRGGGGGGDRGDRGGGMGDRPRGGGGGGGRGGRGGDRRGGRGGGGGGNRW